MKRLFTCVTGLLLASSAWGRSSQRHVLDPVGAVMQRQYRESRQAASAAATPDRGVSAVLPDQGNIAVVDETEGVVLTGGFDLDQKGVEFRPADGSASSYTFAAGASQFDAAAAGSLTAVQLGDDDAKEVNLPFSFPFYGVRYNSIWIHSDGNVTFGQAEASSDPRDFVRLVTGPARVAPLFVDLDPSQPNSAIGYVSSASRFLVMWRNVPVYADNPGPTIPRQTFQMILFPDGRIVFSWSGVNVTTQDVADVGIAPGGATRFAQITFVDYTAGSSQTLTTAIVEEFTNSSQFDITAVPAKFYKSHEDSYDFLVVFDNTTRSDVNACAFALPVKNWVRGIGLRVTSLGIQEFDATTFYSSAGRLQNLVYMGPLSRYPNDPAQNLPPGGICGRNNFLSILGQEAGHRYLAYPRFVDPATGQTSLELLGRDNQHWSFYFNSDASLVEGNQIQDKGAGVSPRFETTEIVARYSKLDRYLMGLLAPEDVPATFFVRNPSIDFLKSHGPQSGVLFDGTRVDVTVPMIVAAEGKRLPDSAVSPKTFHFAFLLVVPPGTTPAPADISKLENLRAAWERFVATATDNVATADTRLAKQLGLSLWPASGLVQGRTVNASVTLAAPASSPVTVSLSASGAGISVPGSVVIPAGSRSASFAITGSGTGTGQVTARGPDSSYETVTAGILVRPSSAGLVLEQLNTAALSGALIVPLSIPVDGGLGANVNEELIFRLRDENFLPYPGLKINTSATGAGGVSPNNPLTDGKGRVRVRWTLDTNPGSNTLTLALDGQPDVTAKLQGTGTIQLPRRRDPRIPAEVAP